MDFSEQESDYRDPVFRREAVWVVLFFITVLGAVLRLRHADTRLLWLDEIHTFQVVNEPATFLRMLKTWWTTFQVSDPPLYYILNYLVSGGNPWASHLELRSVSLAWGIAAIPMTWAVLRLLASEPTALVGALLMAVNAFAVQYSQEYRPYSQLLCLGLVYAYAQIILIVRGFSWGRWVGLLAASACLIMTHYFGGFALAAGYIVWCGCVGRSALRRATGINWRKAALGIVLLPIVLLVIYLPVIQYGIGQTRHFSGLAGGAAAGAMEAAFQAQKSYLNYWTNLPYVLETWYLGSMPLGTTLFVSLLATAGAVRLFVCRRGQFVAVASFALGTLLLGYMFYEAMHYPYEPRRSIYVLPVFLYFVALGITAPLEYCPGRVKPGGPEPGAKKAWRWGAGFLSAAALVACTDINLRNDFRYDSWGYRTQGNLADWKSMAEFIKRVSSRGDVIGVPAGPGNTWYMSQFNFYRKRSHLPMATIPLNSRDDVGNAFRSGAHGIWYISTLPSHIDGELFSDLLSEGQWQAFAGGAVVYLKKPADHQHSFLARHSGEYALLPMKPPAGFISQVQVNNPVHTTLLFDQQHPYNMLRLPQGLVTFADSSTSAADDGEKWSLVPKIDENAWQSAADLSSWEPGSQEIGFPVVNGVPAMMMQYNGKIIYRFWMEKAGTYTLTLEAKNDAPGPIAMKVSMAGSADMVEYAFAQADNSLSQISHRVKLRAGFNEMTFYYHSFKRIKAWRWADADTFNQCIVTRWRVADPATGPDNR